MKQIYNYIQKSRSWFIVTLLAICFASCADEWESLVSPLSSEVTIEVASPETVITRSTEESNTITNLVVMSFKSLTDDNATLQKIKVYETSELTNLGSGKYKVAMEASEWSDSLLFIANATDKITSLETGATLASLKDVSLSSTDVNVMIRKISSSDLSNATTVSVGRVVAKVSAIAENTVTEKFKLQAISLYNGSTSDNLHNVVKGTTTKGTAAIDAGTDSLYSLPCTNETPYLIIKATYAGETCYYRAEFKDNDGKTLNLQSNHHYEFHITSVRTKGYATAEEAAKHEGSIEGYLLDHQPKIFNMISDGISELGVQDTVYFDTDNTAEVKVKWSTKGKWNNVIPTVTVQEGKEWFALNDSTITHTTPDDLQEGQVGYLFTYKFTTSENPTRQPRTAKITFTKNGLSRTTVLIQKAGEKDLDVKMYMKDEYKLHDYWSFLDEAKGLPSTRKNGLHMPRSIDKYEISVPSNGPLADYTIKEVVNKTNGNVFINESYSPTIKNPTTPLTIENKFSEVKPDVIPGGLKLVLEKDGGQEITISYDIYRCGVFQNEKNNKDYRQGASVSEDTYYYYEVVYIGGRLWLDRNLGATSNGMAVRQEDGSYMGDDESAGGLYYLGDVPKGNAMQLINICPRGYRLPTVTEFNQLLSASGYSVGLISSEDGSYFAPTYDLADTTVTDGPTKIYFPMNRMYYSGSLSGDVHAGYYWTQSEAVGSTNGEWAQMVKFMGNNATFERQQIYDNGATAAMSVRCIDDGQITEEATHSIEFYVKGCTHVFLYGKTEDGNVTLLNTWPGTQIAIENEASLGMYHVFKYESLIKYDNYYAIFSNNGANPLPSQNKGELMKNGYKYTVVFNDDGSGSVTDEGKVSN